MSKQSIRLRAGRATARQERKNKVRDDVEVVPTGRFYNSPGFMEVMEDIARERLRQGKLLRDGKIHFNLNSPIVDDNRKLRVLMEEVGELAEAIHLRETCKQGFKPRQRMEKLKRDEIIQIAACCVAWLETPEIDSRAGTQRCIRLRCDATPGQEGAKAQINKTHRRKNDDAA